MQKIKDIDAILVAHFRANKTFPGKCASVTHFCLQIYITVPNFRKTGLQTYG